MTGNHHMTIEEQIRREGNDLCAECCAEEPAFVSLDLGVFVCSLCAKIHKQLKSGLNSVVSLQYRFTEDQINFIAGKGNDVVNKSYEKYLPKYYHRPVDDDPLLLREQFIKAKYEREEFKDLNNQKGYGHGVKEGYLFKRGKGNDKFLQRKFVLMEPDGLLKYFIKPGDKNPKDTIVIRNLVNIYIVPEKVKNNNGMQITHERDGVRRNLFVFGIDGKTTSDWYHALRASMVKHKYRNFPDEQMKKYLNTKIIQEGWMSKTGPKRLEKFKRRWFTLVGNMIWYYTQPLDAHPLGYIALGSRTFGYGVMKGLPQGIKSDGFSLTIHTPDRVYALLCFTVESRDKWVLNIDEILDQYTTPWSQSSLGRLKSESPTSIRSVNPSAYSTTTNTQSPFSSDSENYSSRESSSTNSTPEFAKRSPRLAATGRNIRKDKQVKRKNTRKVQSLIYHKGAHSPHNERSKVNGILKNKHRSVYKNAYSDDSEGILGDTDSENDVDDRITRERLVNQKEEGKVGQRSVYSMPNSKEDQNDHQAHKSHHPSSEQVPPTNKLDSPSEAGPKSEVAKKPKKPPRKKLMKQGTNSSLDLSDGYSSASSREVLGCSQRAENSKQSETISDRSQHIPDPSPNPIQSSYEQVEQLPTQTEDLINRSEDPPGHEPPDNHHLESGGTVDVTDGGKDQTTSKHNLSPNYLTNNTSFSNEEDFLSDIESFRPPSIHGSIDDELDGWRKKTFASSIKRITGIERTSTKSTNKKRIPSISSVASSMVASDVKEIRPRSIDVTLCNQTKEGFWFIVFQSEATIDDVESFVTPWVGAQIAEAPASVGPIRVPSEYQIAVIDTSPGGFGLQRTTGPFTAEPGDVWEVDIPTDDASVPEMYYHEGMEVENGCVAIHSNITNMKKFEIAVYKSGRKLLSRKNIKPGDVVYLDIKPTLYFLAVDQDSYFEMEEQDLRASDILSRTHCIDINFRQPRLKVQAKRRGPNVFFSK